ncbi:hypothetical protein NC652_041291 [Populus alba x Populus x berolinensis]|nr:hypothetical protein NC652_041291 [Populus alba x Populus x berolinensis]
MPVADEICLLGKLMMGMIPDMIASVEVMLKRWRNHEGKEIDAFQEFKVLTSEVISRTAFGSSYLEGQLLGRAAYIRYDNEHD